MITSSVQRYLARRWFLAMLGQFDRNETLGLSARWLGGGALGRTIVDTNRTRLSATAGLVYTEERYTESPKDDRVEVVFGSQWDWFTFGDRSTDFTTSALTFVDATRLNKVRVEVSGSMKFELVKDLDWTFTFFESFNSSPPAEGRRNDAGIRDDHRLVVLNANIYGLRPAAGTASWLTGRRAPVGPRPAA